MEPIAQIFHVPTFEDTTGPSWTLLDTVRTTSPLSSNTTLARLNHRCHDRLTLISSCFLTETLSRRMAGLAVGRVVCANQRIIQHASCEP